MVLVARHAHKSPLAAHGAYTRVRIYLGPLLGRRLLNLLNLLLEVGVALALGLEHGAATLLGAQVHEAALPQSKAVGKMCVCIHP